MPTNYSMKKQSLRSKTKGSVPKPKMKGGTFNKERPGVETQRANGIKK